MYPVKGCLEMKFSDETLLEIIDIVRRGILGMTDISQELRNLRFETNAEELSIKKDPKK